MPPRVPGDMIILVLPNQTCIFLSPAFISLSWLRWDLYGSMSWQAMPISMYALRVSHPLPVATDFLNTGDTHRNLRFARSHRYPREGTLCQSFIRYPNSSKSENPMDDSNVKISYVSRFKMVHLSHFKLILISPYLTTHQAKRAFLGAQVHLVSGWRHCSPRGESSDASELLGAVLPTAAWMKR